MKNKKSKIGLLMLLVTISIIYQFFNLKGIEYNYFVYALYSYAGYLVIRYKKYFIKKI